MPIRFRCRKCKTRIKVPDGSEGANVRCPSCNERQRVPAGDASERSAIQPAITEDAAPGAAPVDTASSSAVEDPAAALASLSTGDSADSAMARQDVEATSPDAAPHSDADEPTSEDESPQEEADDQDESSPDTSLESDETESIEASPAGAAAAASVTDAERQLPAPSAEGSEDAAARTTAEPAAASPPPFYPNPKPRPTPQPQPHVARSAPASSHTPPPGSTRRPAPAQPRVIATSSRPTEHRPAARPVPITEPSTSGLPSAGGSLSAMPEPFSAPSRTPPPPLTLLNVLTWVLRVWAILLVPVVVKEILTQFDMDQTFVAKVLGAVKLLGWPVLAWATAEVVAVARRVAQQTHRG